MDAGVRARLEAMEQKLRCEPKIPLFNSASWAITMPERPGVYVLWEKKSGRPIYVGETTCLRERMRDLGRKVNHTCRRKLATKLKLEHATEKELSDAMRSRYLLSAIEVDFGRKELEEYLSLRWAKLLNSPEKRLRRVLGSSVTRARTQWAAIAED